MKTVIARPRQRLAAAIQFFCRHLRTGLPRRNGFALLAMTVKLSTVEKRVDSSAHKGRGEVLSRSMII